MALTRRLVLFGAGALAIGGGLAVGSGAFGGTSTRRGVTVEFADDSDAYLGMGPISDDDRDHVTVTEGGDGVVEIKVNQVNVNSRTVMGDLVAITNNSTRDITQLTVTINDESDNADLSVRNIPDSIDSGETVTGLGLAVDTTDYSGDPSLKATIRITSVLEGDSP